MEMQLHKGRDARHHDTTRDGDASAKAQLLKD